MTTRLRHVSAKDVLLLEAFLSQLGFKVEIKGGPVATEGRWYLFFIIPDQVPDDFLSVDLPD